VTLIDDAPGRRNAVAPERESTPAETVVAANHGPIERGYCRLHRTTVPNLYPVQLRPDMAIRRPTVVATRPGEELLCNSEHSGPHLWPNGDEAGDWPTEPDP
jgi:hypothetical protein